MNKQEEINLYGVSNEPTKITENAMRTEQEILKEFEEIGLKVTQNDSEFLVFTSKFNNYTLTIIKEFKGVFHQDDCAIECDEIKLLCELFKCWGWI